MRWNAQISHVRRDLETVPDGSGPATSLSTLLMRNSTLRVLSLSGMCVAGGADTESVGRALAQNKSLRVFAIGDGRCAAPHLNQPTANPFRVSFPPLGQREPLMIAPNRKLPATFSCSFAKHGDYYQRRPDASATSDPAGLLRAMRGNQALRALCISDANLDDTGAGEESPPPPERFNPLLCSASHGARS